jgi:glucose-1-phosphate thymidylyltransferase
VAEVTGWYDCGKLDTLLETNLHLLRNGRSVVPPPRPGVTVVPPVRVAAGVTLEESTIGPNVTLDEGAVVRRSVVRDAIVGQRARIEGATVREALVGDDAVVRGGTHERMVVARDEAAPAR